MCFPFLPVKEQQVTSRDKLNASHFFLLVFMFGSPCLVVLRTYTWLCLRDQLRVGLVEHALCGWNLGGLPVSQGLPLYPFSLEGSVLLESVPFPCVNTRVYISRSSLLGQI